MVEGQAGTDRLDFAGANIAETFTISANGERVLFTRDVGTVTMDVNDVERIDVHALGGADTITVNDLTGTDLPLAGVAVDLEGALGTGVGDGQVDQVIVNGTAGDDAINLLSIGGGAGILITGSPAPVAIFHSEATDQLTINGGAGGDVINASGLNAGQVGLTLNLGAGGDVFFGSQGNDLVNGGAGNDPGSWARAMTCSSGTRRRQRHGRGSAPASTRSCSTAPISPRPSRSRPTASACASLATSAPSRWMSTMSSWSISTPSAAPTPSWSTISPAPTFRSPGCGLISPARSGVADGALDSVTVNGGAGNETINVTPFNGGVLVSGTPAAVGIFHADATDQLIVNGGAGNDTINASTLAAGAISLTLNGGAGDDVLTGSQGNDLLLGDDGNDVVVGGAGSDTALLGAGNDTFFWNPGDGSDVVEGQAGTDRLDFAGANIAETFTISANGERVRFTRDVGTVTMDVNDVERIDVHALGGADTIVINDLTGTDLPLAGVAVDLEGALGTGVGDGQVDQVIVNGTAGDDAINLLSIGGGAGILITGSPAPVAIFHSEATDQLTINGGAGGDVINASGLNAGQIGLTLNGGAGNDVLFGSQGDDLVDGGAGNDAGFLGAGNDVFVWNPGDGSDTVEGQAGFDRLDFNGANIAEIFDISANGERVRFTRDIGTVTMDLNDVEQVDVHALGGADTIMVNDLTGTDLPLAGVKIDLEGVRGSGVADGALDSVTVNGGAGNETINVTPFNGGVLVSGTPAAVGIFHADATDQLIVNGGAGNDTINASTLAAGAISLTLNGGAGDDVLTGSQGNDLLLGDDGNDVVVGGAGSDTALLGAGNDTFFWNPGDGSDVVEGQAGTDRLDFAGANIAETFDDLGQRRARTLHPRRRHRHDGRQRRRAHRCPRPRRRRHHHGQRPVRDRRQQGQDRSVGCGRRRRRPGGYDCHQRYQRQRRDHGQQQQRHGDGVGSGRRGDDLRLRGNRSHRDQWPRRRGRHRGIRTDRHAAHHQWRHRDGSRRLARRWSRPAGPSHGIELRHGRQWTGWGAHC